MIKQIPLINVNREDELMWMYSKDGNYSVKSGYFSIQKWKQDKCPEPSSTSNLSLFGKSFGLLRLFLDTKCFYGLS
jgi:hypothetical protein